MPGYLEAYGAGSEKREKIVRRVALVVLVVLVAGTALYFLLRNFRETRQANLFFELLARKDYSAAYALWGCSPTSPCRDYTMDKFVQDWGPTSAHADLSTFKITKTRSCTAGVIFEAQFGSNPPDYLWVDRETKDIGFAPWPVCNPRLPKQ